MSRKSEYTHHAPGELPAGLRARSFGVTQENQLYFARAYRATAVDVAIVMPPRSDDEPEACTRREQVRRPRVPMR